MSIDKNSMLYWHPKIKDLPLYQPKTEILEIPTQELFSWLEKRDKAFLDRWQAKIFETAEKIGYPLFLRTDQASAKFFWDRTCFVKNKDTLLENIYWLLDFHHQASMLNEITNYKALVFREFIEMDTMFTAHYNMPVNPEIRFFADKGKILCWHWYWPEDSIQNSSCSNWKDIISGIKNGLKKELIDSLIKDAKFVSSLFPDAMSIDFCQARDKKWILIDMALMENSWHSEDCPNYTERKI